VNRQISVESLIPSSQKWIRINSKKYDI